jgi:hypothetical protein
MYLIMNSFGFHMGTVEGTSNRITMFSYHFPYIIHLEFIFSFVPQICREQWVITLEFGKKADV